MNRIEKVIGNSVSMAAGIIFPDLGNCDLELSSSQLEKRTLARKVAELTFLARFGREVTSTLNMEAVITTSAKLIFDNFFFDKIEFDISAPFGAIYTVYSSVDEKSLRSAYMRRGGTKPVINGYKSLGLSVPKSPSRRNGQTHIPLPGDSGRLIVYPAINSVKDRSSLLTGIGEIVFQAVKNAHEHGIVKERSLRDSLTGLFNRRVLEEMLSIEISRRDQGPVALMVLDLDNFKRINDSFGHPAGDLVLSTFGAILRKCCRTTDIIARYGGEEFAVLVSGYSSEVALKIAERLRKTLEEHQFHLSGEQVCITTSIGVAFREEGVDSSEELLSRADQALYNAKKNGKNQVSVFHSDPTTPLMPRAISIRGGKKNPALATIAA